MSRINYKFANSPIVFVAPHGHPADDLNTDLIAIAAADSVNGNFIVNTGFKRGKDPSPSKDVADCNNRLHCKNAEVENEFLIPYVKICRRALKYFGKCFVIWVHGVGNDIRKLNVQTTNLDMIVGYGLGKPDSLTCYEGIINKFLYEIRSEKLNCFVGSAGGKYSGFDHKNMNQYWRKYILEDKIQSFQLEIIKDLRSDRVISELTADCIADAVINSIEHPNYKLPAFMPLNYI
jgi:hypothetical protein